MASLMRGHIIRVNKGEVPPKEHISDIMEKFDTVAGIAFIDNGKLCTLRVFEPMGVDKLMGLLESSLKPLAVVIWFGKCDSAYSEDDVQPFTSMNDQIAVFLEAPFEDFSHPENPESKHSRAFYAFHESFQPEIENSAELADNDLDKVLRSLIGNNFKRKMDKELLKEGGACVIFAKTGEINQWCTNTTAVTTPWGWTSDDFSSSQEEEETMESSPQSVEPEKPKSLLDSISLVLGSKTASVKVTAKEPEPVKTETKVVEALNTSTANVSPKPIMWSPKLVPGHETWSNKRMKEQYYLQTGQLPEGWQNKIECRVIPGKGKYKPTGFQVLQAHPIASTVPIEQNKPEEVVPDTATRIAVLSAKGQERMDELLKDKTFKKYLDSSSYNVQDPEVAQKIEKRVPFLEEQRGMKTGETLGWPLEAYEAMCTECPEEAGILLLNRAGQMISMQRAITGMATRLNKVSRAFLEMKQTYEPDKLTDEEKAVINSWTVHADNEKEKVLKKASPTPTPTPTNRVRSR